MTGRRSTAATLRATARRPNALPGRSVLRRAAPRATLLAAFGVFALFAAHPAIPQGTDVSNGAAEPAATRSFREIHVPRGRLEEWLRTKDWTPIGAKEYLARRAAERRGDDGPPATRIERAVYEATFDDGALRDGGVRFDVARLGTVGVFHSLEPHSFALTELVWSDAEEGVNAEPSSGTPREPESAAAAPSQSVRPDVPAWGADESGRTLVLVDRSRGALHGRWTQTGRRGARGVAFELSLPAAASSSLLLRVPAGCRVVVSAGDPRGPQPDSRPGWALWQIDLGSRSRTRLDVLLSDESSGPSTQQLVRSDVGWDIREDGLRYMASFDVETGDGEVGGLEFDAPPELTVHRVTSGGNVRIAWSGGMVGTRQRLRVPLVEGERGRSRTVRLEATAPLRLNERWELPRVTAVGPAFVEGRAALRVDGPLELQSTTARGLIQTGVSIDDEQGESAQFRQDLGAAELTVSLGYPAPGLSARALSALERVDDHWVCRCDVEWRALSSGTFQTAADFPADWDILEVRGATERESRLRWDVARNGSGRRRLLVDFAEPLSPAAPRLVTVVLRQLGPASETALELPVLRPEGAESRHAVLAPDEASGAGDVALEGRSAVEALREFERFPLLKDTTDRSGKTPRVVLWNQTPGAAGLVWRDMSRVVRARSWATVDLAADPCRESLICWIDPAGRAFDQVHLYLSGPLADIGGGWEILGESTRPAAEKLDSSRHSDFGYPREGELWRIALPGPRHEPFRLRIEGVPAASSDFLPVLAFVPEAARFTGHVQVNSSPDRRFEVRARGLLPLTVPAANVERERFGLPAAAASRVWRYESSSDRLQIVSQVGGEAPATLQCVLHSRIRSGPGEDLHAAVFQQGGGRPAPTIEFELPPPARLITVRVDGEIATVRPGGGRHAFVAPAPEGRAWNRLVVEYATPGRTAGMWTECDVVLPDLGRRTVDFRWTFALPAGVRPERISSTVENDTEAGGAPSGLAWAAGPRAVSWRRRLFGPLGRPSDEPVFNPASPVASLQDAWSADSDFEKEPDETVWVAVGATRPRAVRVVAARGGVVRTLGFSLLLATMLIGILVRRAGLPSRGSIASTTLIVSMVAAFLCSESIATLAGAVFTGVLLTMIVPRRLFARQNPRERPRGGVPTGSTASFRHAAVGAAGLFAAGLGMADAFGFPDVRNDDPDPIDVLIPYDVAPVDRRPPPSLPDLVYLPRQAAARLSAPASAGSNPGALVRLERGGATVSDDLVRATLRFRVVLFGQEPTVRVPIGLTEFAPADGDACRVDGAPAPLERDERGYRIVFDRPSPGGAARSAGGTSHVVELTGFCRVRSEASEKTAALDLLPGPAAPVVWTFPPTFVPSDPTPGPIETDGAGNRRVGGAGRRAPPAVRWFSTPGNRPTPRTEIELRLSRFVEAAPSALEIHNRVVARVLRGSVENLSWPIPDDAVVQKVQGEGVEAWSVSTPPAGGRRLSIEFGQPRTGDFRLDIVFLSPTPPDGPILVAPWAIERTDDARIEARLVLRQAALAPRSGYRLSVPLIESETTRSIPVESFVRGASDWDAARRAVSAWQLYESVAIPVSLTPVVPMKTVRTAQETTLSPRDAIVRLRAEIVTTEATAFRHALRVDPRLQVESVSVVEDQADRLARWFRSGDRLVVTLDSGTAGAQDFTLVGRMPLDDRSEFPLPILRFDDATASEARVTVFAAPELDASVVAPGPLTPLRASPDGPTVRPPPSDATDGHGTRLVGRFEAAGEGEPTVRVVRVADRARVEIVSAVAAEASEARWSARLRFTGLRGRPNETGFTLRGIEPERLRVRTTPETRFTIEPADERTRAGGAVEGAPPSDPGSPERPAPSEPAAQVEFPDLSADLAVLDVEISCDLPRPEGPTRSDAPRRPPIRDAAPVSDADGPRLPTIEPAARLSGHWFVVPRSQPWTLPPDVVAAASSDDLPTWHARPSAPGELQPPIWRLDAAPRRIVLRAAAQRDVPELLEARTGIVWPGGEPPFARTVLRLMPRGGRIALRMPDDAVVRAVLRNGEPLVTTTEDGGRLRITLPDDLETTTLEVHWLPGTASLPLLGRRLIELPAVVARGGRHEVALTMPTERAVRETRPAGGGTSADSAPFDRVFPPAASDGLPLGSPVAVGATGGDDAGDYEPATLTRAFDVGGSAAPDAAGAIEVRIFDSRLVSIPLLLLSAAAAGAAARWLLKAGAVGWIQRRRSTAAAALGLLWWFAFQFSPFGFVLFAGSLLHAGAWAFRSRTREVHV